MLYLAVAAGGFLGAIIRSLLGNIMIKEFTNTLFPMNTFVINLTGCFLLTLLLKLTSDRLNLNHSLKVGLSTGLLGAYTTFSTFSLETVILIREGLFWYAAAYGIGTPVGCLLLGWAGFVAAGIFNSNSPEAGKENL